MRKLQNGNAQNWVKLDQANEDILQDVEEGELSVAVLHARGTLKSVKCIWQDCD